MRPMTDIQEEQNEQTRLTPWDIEIKREQVQRTLTMQEGLLTFLKWLFGIGFALTLPTFIVVLFLDGWRVGGFDLSDKVLMMLGGVALGEIAGLMGTAIKTFLRPFES